MISPVSIQSQLDSKRYHVQQLERKLQEARKASREATRRQIQCEEELDAARRDLSDLEDQQPWLAEGM